MKISSNAQSFGLSVFDSETTASIDLGAKMESADGRSFRYMKVGATALVAGSLYDGPASVGNHTNVTVALAAAVGATSITVTLGATLATANQYAGGVIVINDVDGQGFTYGIKSHPAADASASLVLTLESNELVLEALTTSSQASLVSNQYNGVIIHAASETGIPVGIAIKDIAAASFGWIQTRGSVSSLADANVAALGEQVDASTTTAGATTLGTVATAALGYAQAQQVSTEFNPIFLTID